MATDVGIKVKVDGEKTFRSAIQAINQQTKELNAEMKAAMAGMSGMASSEEKVAQQTKLLSDYIDKNKEKVQVLSQQYDQAKTRLDELGRELDEAKSKGGENTAEVQRAENAYNRQAAEVAKLGTQLANTNAEIAESEAKLKTLGNSASESARKLKAAGESLQSIGKGLQTAGGSLTKIGTNLTKYVTAPVLAVGTAAVKFASDYTENLNKVDAAFKDNADEIKAWARTATKNFGMSESAALEVTSLFGDMGTSMGLTTKEAALMSKNLAGLAGDLASFKNISIEQSMTALKGVFTGETESLKTLGIVMTQTNLKQFASDMGLVYDSMSEAEKVTLRYQYVLAKTTNAQGDYLRTADGTANSMRTLKASLENLGAAFGQEIIPMITPLIQKLTDAAQAFGELSDSQKSVVVNLGLTAAAVGPATTAIGKLVTGIGTGVEAAGKFASALSAGGGIASALTSTLGMGGTIGLAVAGVAALTAGGLALTFAIADALDPVKQLNRALEDLSGAQKALAQHNEVIDLANQYEELRAKLNDATLSEEEHTQVQLELQDVLAKLSDVTDGAVVATENLTEATDTQVEAAKELAEIEKERASADIYANLLKQADSYHEAMLDQKRLVQEVEDAEQHLGATRENLTGNVEEQLENLQSVLEDTRDKLEAGIISADTAEGAAELEDILNSLEDQLYDLTGIEVEFEGLADAEAYFEDLTISTEDSADAALDASDNYEALSGELGKTEKATSEFRNAVLNLTKSGFITSAQAADLLGVSVEGLDRMMVAYEQEITQSMIKSGELAGSFDDVADAADEEADALDEAAQAAAEAHKAIIDIASSAIEARYSGKDLRETYNELSSELDKLRDSGDEAAIMLAEQKLYLLDIAATNDELADGFAKMGISAEGSLTSLSQYLIDAGVSADDYLSGVQSMRDGVVNAFKTLRDENALTASEMTAVLQDNLQVQRDWGNNLAYLWNQTADNTVRAYINYLAQQGPQYASAVAEFASGGYDELVAQAYLWAEAGQLSSDQYAWGIYANEYLAGNAAGDVADSALDEFDIYGEARSEGEDAGRGYTRGIDSIDGKPSGTSLASSSVSGMKTQFADMKSAAQMLARGGLDMVKAAAPQFRTAGQQLGVQFTQGYQSQLGSSRTAASTMINQMLTALRSAVGQIRSIGTQLGQQFAQGISAQAGYAQSGALAMARNAASAAGSLTSYFRSAGSSSGNSYASGVSGAAGSAKSAGSYVAKSALSGSQISGWYTVGYNMAYGMANGIYGGSYLVSNAAWYAAKQAYYAACSYLGINSPSRLFRDEVGLMIGEGMAEGILASSKTVDNAVTSLGLGALNAVNSNMAMGSGMGSVSNSTYNLTPTVYVYGAEGQNVDELAAAVEQRINESLIRRL